MSRVAFLCLVVVLVASCGQAASTPSCKTQLAADDTGLLSWPCPGAPGHSYGCTGSPSQVPLVDCEIDDGKIGDWRTVCAATCPDVPADASTER